MKNPFKNLYKVSIFREFGEHLDGVGDDEGCTCCYFDILEELCDTLSTWTGWKLFFKDYKRILGVKGVHRNTPWWEKVLLVLYTAYSYSIGLVGLVAILVLAIMTFKIEFVIWLRERAKINRRKKAVQYIMDKKKQGYDSPSWKDEGA